MTRLVLTIVLVALAAGVPVSAFAEKKTDILVMDNGDQITGEVSTLQRGKLSFKTDNMGTLSIEWKHVTALTSRHMFVVELSDGRQLYGSLGPGKDETAMAIIGLAAPESVPLVNVSLIQRIRSGFWRRLKGSVNIGVTYTKANELFQWNISANANHRTEKWYSQSSLVSTLNVQQNQPTTTNSQLNFNETRFFQTQWTLPMQLSFQRNSELGIDFRLLTTAGAGYSFLSGTDRLLMATVGLSMNYEVPIDSTATVSMELPLGLRFDYYTYDSPKRDVSVRFDVRPSLTESGRWRGDLNTQFSWELISDFTWGFTVVFNYDNRPPAGSSSTTDATITTSVGYTF